MSRLRWGATDSRVPNRPPSHVSETADVSCPYCGEIVSIALDPAGGRVQEYVEDCQVCCRPWHVVVRYDAGHGAAEVTVTAADDL